MSEPQAPTSQRLDKWLWHARLFRTRSLAARAIAQGRLRVNGTRVIKPAHALHPGDGLTVTLDQSVRVLRVAGFSDRRAGAAQAPALFDDLAPPPAPPPAPITTANPPLSGPGMI